MTSEGGSLCATPTRDLRSAEVDLVKTGYCIVTDVIPENLRQALHERVLEQAEAERRKKIDHTQDGNTQWIANVLNKGEAFLKLLTLSEDVHTLIRSVLGDAYILSCSNSPIAGPGTGRMSMHADQHWSPRIEADPAYNPRMGNLTFENMEMETEARKREHLFPPCMVTLMWTITEFTEENGATVFIPGSHRSGRHPQYDAPFENSVCAQAPAGSVILWDGRSWHATGANKTTDDYRIGVTNNYVAPMIRPLVNYPYSLRPQVVAKLSDREKALLGFSTWSSYGNEGVPSQSMRYFKPASEQTGPLYI